MAEAVVQRKVDLFPFSYVVIHKGQALSKKQGDVGFFPAWPTTHLLEPIGILNVNKSERPVDALAVKISITHSLAY